MSKGYPFLMAIIVQKYGGSSVADVQKLNYVAERVMATSRQGHHVCVVVSAMGDTTDELLTMAKQVSPNPDRRELDMLLSAGERISMALLSMAIRELGGVFGVAVLAAVFSHVGGYETGTAFVDGMTSAVFIGGVVVALGAVAAAFIKRRPVALAESAALAEAA